MIDVSSGSRACCTDKDRFQQLQRLLLTLSVPDPIDYHPAQSLMQLDDICEEIRAKRGLLSSELLQALDTGLQRQWSPILNDNQRLLQSLGGKMLVLGVVEVIGKLDD